MRFVNYFTVLWDDRDESCIEWFDTMYEAKEFYDEIVESTRYNNIYHVELRAGDDTVEEYNKVDE